MNNGLNGANIFLKYKFNDNNIKEFNISNISSLLDIKLYICMEEGGLNIDNFRIIMWRNNKPTIYLENDDFKSLQQLFIKNDDLFCIFTKNNLYRYPY